LDVLAVRFEKRWQLQRFAKRGERFIDGETGNVRRDLEQDTTRLPEVNRAEIVAVFLFCGMHAMVVYQRARHLGLLCVATRPKRYVMNRTTAKAASQEAFRFIDVNQSAGRCACRAIADGRAFASVFGKAEHAGEDRSRFFRAIEQQRDTVESADRVFG